ncbi:MAG: YqaA family protein [Methylicorpusculum sp.]|nr:YqaA family protein [Methylicorpusculum sp.]
MGDILGRYYLELLSLFVSAFISSTLAPGGSEIVLGYLVLGGSYDVMVLVLIATIGNTLGAITTWFLGLCAAKKFPLENLLPKNKQRAIDWMRSWGKWSLLFSWLPVVGDGFCFASGWLKYPLITFVLFVTVGKFCRYALIAWLLVEG